MSDLDLAAVDRSLLPNHVGVIMDGNGRWAHQRGLDRTAGHAAGEAALFDAVQAALAVGLRWLTVFTFSTENWSRPEDEVEFLMFFNEDLLLRRRDELHSQGVRMRFLGDLEDPRIPDRNRTHMAEATALTAGNERLDLVFAFNHGGRDEIARAARELATEAVAGLIDPERIDVAAVTARLPQPEIPAIDLVIRSSGEQRMSNFMLWRSAYAEFSFPEVLWPDFTGQHLIDCLVDYQARNRRFGGI